MSQPGWGGRARALVRSYWTPAGRRAFWNLTGLIVCTGVSQVLGFLGLVILANGLGPGGYAAIALAGTVQWYLISIGLLGLPALVVRDLTRRPDEADPIITCFLGTAAVSATLAGLTVAGAVWFIPLSHGERFYLTVIGLCNVVTCLNLAPLFDAAHRQAFAALLTLPFEVVVFLTLLALRSSGMLTIENVAAVNAARLVAVAALLAVVYHRWVRPVRLRWSWTWFRHLVRGGWPSMVTTLVTMVPFHAGLLLARMWRGEQETGIYGLSLAIAGAYLTAGLLAVRVVQPHVSGPYGPDPRFARKVAVFGAAFLTGLWVAAAIASSVLVFCFLEPAYRPALGTALILLTTTALLVAAVFGNCYLIAFHSERLMMWLYAATAVLYLAAAAAIRDAELPVFAGAAVAAMLFLAAGIAAGVAWVWPRGGDRPAPAAHPGDPVRPPGG